jgi:replicative DNA helicase
LEFIMKSDDRHQRTTLQQHLKGLDKVLHELNEAARQDTLTAEEYCRSIQDLLTFAVRDFRSTLIIETSVKELLDDYWGRAKKRQTAAPTGLAGLDNALNGGFQAKRLVMLLGAPGSGKTSLANQMGERIARERPVLYATSEDTPDILISKTLSRLSNIKYSAALYGWNDYRTEIDAAIHDLAQRPSSHNLRYLDCTAGMLSIAELRDRAQQHFEGKPGPGLIIVDYLQRMARAIKETTGTKELREAVTALTERLRSVASELDCCVLAVASMNRASGYGKNSENNVLAAAKESGDIEYTADVMMALTEDTKRMTSSWLKPFVLRIDKNRQGVTKNIELDWDTDHQRFIEVEGRL